MADAKIPPRQNMPEQKPDSTGPNARPRDESIAQTGSGLPDDSSRPVEVDPAVERKMEEKFRSH